VARGRNAKVGDTRVSDNGYHYTKCENKWRLTHHLIAEKKLGRALETGERVSFVDNDRTNLDPDNITVRKAGGGSLERRRGQLEARIQELQAELDEVNDQIARAKKLQASTVSA